MIKVESTLHINMPRAARVKIQKWKKNNLYSGNDGFHFI